LQDPAGSGGRNLRHGYAKENLQLVQTNTIKRQLPTDYTDFLRDYAKKNLQFVQIIEQQITQLVQNRLKLLVV
jgi:hypothetical protein